MTDQEKPLTRDDVLRLIEDNGGPEGLDLSKRKFQEEIDLSNIDLHGAILRGVSLSGASLSYADLTDTDLSLADLSSAMLRKSKGDSPNFKEADLRNADLQGVFFRAVRFERAKLQYANLRGARLPFASFRDAILIDADLRDTDLDFAGMSGTKLHGCKLDGAIIEDVEWGPKYIIGDEEEASKLSPFLGELFFPHAESAYRHLKQCYGAQGMHHIAAQFHYREMEVRRKGLPWRKKEKFWLWATRVLTGHMEKPQRVAVSALVVWLLFGMAYMLLGWIWGLVPLDPWHIAYVSTVSFTALGFGSWVATDSLKGAAQGVAAVESIFGVFFIALFLTTFVRKMTR